MLRRIVQPWIILYLTFGWQSRARCRAARWLGKHGTRRAVKPLVRALRDRAPTVRTCAAESLGLLGKRRAFKPLIKALRDTDQNVQSASVGAIGLLGDKRGVRPLLDIMGRSVELDRTIKYALVHIGRRSPRSLIRAFTSSGGIAAQTLAEVMAIIGDERFARPLTKALKLGDVSTRRSAVKAFGLLARPQDMKPLLSSLKDGDRTVRATAAEMLGHLRHREALHVLVETFRDEDWRVRQAASIAVAKLGPCAYEALVRPLSDPRAEVRECAVESLGQLGDSRAKEHVIVALRDPSGLVRAVAVEAVGKQGDQGYLSYLVAALADQDELVRMSACEALGSIGSQKAVKHLNRSLDDPAFIVRNAASRALKALGFTETLESEEEDHELNKLIIMLTYDSKKARLEAVRRLSKIGGATVVEPLCRALKDTDLSVRSRAIENLGLIGDQQAITSLSNILRGPSQPQSCRTAAAHSLGKIRGCRSYAFLVSAFRDESSAVREAALRSALVFDEPILEPLLDISKGAEPETLYLVAKCLSTQNDRRAIDLLETLSTNSWWEVRSAAATSLGKFGEEACKPLEALIDDTSLFVRAAAVSALGSLGVEAAFQPLVRALGDTRRLVRQGAKEALQDMPNRPTSALEEALESPSRRVRRAAAGLMKSNHEN